jgi:hypothetical protein
VELQAIPLTLLTEQPALSQIQRDAYEGISTIYSFERS